MIYTVTDAEKLPPRLIWFTPPEGQGQTVEVSYAENGTPRTEAVRGAAWMRVVDRSIAVGKKGRETYYRLDA